MAKKTEHKDDKKLNERHKAFCREYILNGFNASAAYRKAYPDTTNQDTIKSNAYRLLTYDYIQAYIKELREDTEKLCNINKEMIIGELKSIAFSNIGEMHETWMERKQLDKLTTDERKSIQEITSRTGRTADGDLVEYVKVKLHDKGKALDMLAKIIDAYAAQKHDHTTKGKAIGGFNYIEPKEE
jgi:phage terminase small subunit